MPFALGVGPKPFPSQLFPRRRPATGWPLRRYLFAMAIALLVPLLAFTGAIVWHYLTVQYADLRRDMLNTVQALSLAIDSEWDTARAILSTLSVSPSLDTGDLQAFYDLCTRAIAHRPGTWIVLFDSSGQQVLNTLYPFGAALPNVFLDDAPRPEHVGALPLASPETVRRAFETGQPVYSDLFVGLVSQRPTVSIDIPVLRQGRAIYSLNMGLSPEVFARLIKKDVPDDPLALILDRQGSMIARSQDSAQYVGQLAAPELLADIATGVEGWDRARTRKQVPIYHAWTHSPITGWTTVITVPEASVIGPIKRSLAFALVGAVLFLGLGVGLALLVLRRVTIPLAALARSADQVQRGQPFVMPQVAVQEVQELYAALAVAADAVRRHAEEWEQRLMAEAKAAERHRAAEAIRKLNQDLQQRLDEFQTLFDVVPIGIGVATNPECRHILVNPYFAALLHLPTHTNASLTALPGERPATFRVERDGRELPSEELPMQYVAAHGVAIRDVEVEIVHAEGQRIKLLCHVEPLFDEGHQVRGCIGVFLDITARKQAEEAIREDTRRKDEFLAVLAHELRNPLASIRNAVELLHQVSAPDPHLQQARQIIDRQVDHLVRLIDDLLDVARIARGTLILRKAPVALSTVIEHALETSRSLIEARQHHLTVRLPTEPVYLDGDLTRLAQVVANLLHNAAKYTKEGGQIWLMAAQEAGEVVIRVRDTGIGIAAAFLPRVFEPFTRADHALSRTDSGLGIGLALVRHLVEAHGGRVAMFSEGLGQGCEVVVHLPGFVQSPSPQVTIVPEDSQAEASPGYRILVVDDYVDTAKSLAILLRRKGHTVQVAHDGPTALALVPTFQPQVIVLDIGLPGMDGYEVATRLRNAPELHETVLIALTGYGQQDDLQRTKQAGFHHHLIKPIKIQTLYALLEDLGVRAGS